MKGLEGSTDLPTTRAAITARLRDGAPARILLHPREHGIDADEVAWSNLEQWQDEALAALAGEGPLAPALRWNVGAYLWCAGQLESLPAALAQADALLAARAGLAALERLRP